MTHVARAALQAILAGALISCQQQDAAPTADGHVRTQSSRSAASASARTADARSGGRNRRAPTAVDTTVDDSSPIRPNPRLTPGATFPVTVADICTPGYSRSVRNVPADVKRQVYSEYGIESHAPGAFEVDHLISLELGGSNSIKNLWPESFHTSPWNAHVKDALENRLHKEICAGETSLEEAQREIATDWIAAYKAHFHRDAPRPRQRRNSAASAGR